MTEPRPKLVVVYGPPFSGTGETAWAIAEGLAPRSAVLSVDALMEAIVVPWDDQEAELEMVHQQVRLLTVQYLRQGYNLVLEGPFLFERGGRVISYEAHIDQTLALMRNLVSTTVVARINADSDLVRGRAEAAGAPDPDAVARVAAGYRSRSYPGALAFDAASWSPEGIAEAVLDALRGEVPDGRR